MDVKTVSAESIRRIADNFRGGLRVIAVEPDGVAAAQGIEPDDTLVGIHIWETVSVDNLRYIVSEADFEGKEEVPFYVVRDGKTLAGTFKVDDFR